MYNDINKKTILITGASRGIGRAIALAFAEQGNHIVINSCHNEKALLETKKEIESLGSSCLAMLGDIGNPDFVKKLFQEIHSVFGNLQILINNAGISYVKLITDTTIDEWNRILSTNLSSAFYCCNKAIPDMLHHHSGKIINISSVWGNVGASMEVAYSATKGGINAFTKALAKELAPSNIQVNAIACGAIDTDMNSFLSLEERATLIEEIPSNRLGSPKEVAHLVLQLCEENTYLTGQVITLDGGWI